MTKGKQMRERPEKGRFVYDLLAYSVVFTYVCYK